MSKGWCASALVLSGIALSAAAPANAGTYTRYDKIILSLESSLDLAATRLWLKSDFNKA